MAEYKWIKIVTDIFDDDKIKLIEGMPKRDTVLVVWFKLLCLAGKQNNNGVFVLNDRVAYTPNMLATIFNRPEKDVKAALDIFEQYGMIEYIDGVLTIPKWGKHQQSDAYERKKESDRVRQQKKA